MSLFDNIGGRRFFVVLTIILLSFILTLLKLINSDNWVTVSMSAMAIYVAGKVTQDYIFSKKVSDNNAEQ